MRVTDAAIVLLVHFYIRTTIIIIRVLISYKSFKFSGAGESTDNQLHLFDVPRPKSVVRRQSRSKVAPSCSRSFISYAFGVVTRGAAGVYPKTL